VNARAPGKGRGGARTGLCVVALLLAGAAATSSIALAEPCPAPWEAADGPLPGGTGPADFGAIPEACGLPDFSLRLRGALLVAPSMPDYYGSIDAGAMLRLQRSLTAESWFSIALDLARYRYVNRSGLASDAWSIGPPTLGFHRSLVTTEATTFAGYVRALLPLDSARSTGVEIGLEVGAAFRARLSRRFAADGGLALTTPLDVVGGQVHVRVQPVALGEVWYAPRPAAAVAAGIAAKAELGPDPAFITAVPRFAGRLALRHGLWMAALVELPVVGTDRTDLVASLFLGYGS
jgi:hypothetical protein